MSGQSDELTLGLDGTLRWLAKVRFRISQRIMITVGPPLHWWSGTVVAVMVSFPLLLDGLPCHGKDEWRNGPASASRCREQMIADSVLSLRTLTGSQTITLDGVDTVRRTYGQVTRRRPVQHHPDMSNPRRVPPSDMLAEAAEDAYH